MLMFSPVAIFKTLDDITLEDLPLVGGKASNCARLKQAGIPVPDGLVIPSDATDADVRQLASDPWLASLPADALFAVRSSGIGEDSEGHSFAGIHETQLNVRRDQIVEAVVGCRRSATSEQAMAYRKARGLEDEDDDDRIGVLVQRMVPAVTAGDDAARAHNEELRTEHSGRGVDESQSCRSAARSGVAAGAERLCGPAQPRRAALFWPPHGARLRARSDRDVVPRPDVLQSLAAPPCDQAGGRGTRPYAAVARPLRTDPS